MEQTKKRGRDSGVSELANNMSLPLEVANASTRVGERCELLLNTY